MRVTVFLFAALRDIVGTSQMECEVPDGCTVEGLWQQCAEARPALTPHRAALAVAVDESFARFTTPLREGSVVAFLPPVSGG